MDSSSQSWDVIADVIVVGYGGAGASAAIEATRLGSNVMILEKARAGGGNTKLSYAYLCNDDEVGASNYIEAIKKIEHGSRVSKDEQELIQAYVAEDAKNNDWLKSIGAKVDHFSGTTGYPKFPPGAGYPSLPGAESVRLFKISGESRGGQNLFKVLEENVRKLGIPVHYGTRAMHLLTNRSGGKVIGVLAEREGKTFRYAARKGVVLACGGFEYADDLKSEFLPGGPYFGIGAPTNTGDGIRMATELGAALWHMNCVSGYPCVKRPEYDHAFPLGLSKPAFVFVDKHGKRFMNEGDIEAHLTCLAVTYFDPVALEYPRIPCYVIFDKTNFQAGTLCPEWRLYGQWSADNTEEVKKGWIVQGSSFRELAKNIGFDQDVLARTLEDYNSSCKLGHDDQFGRRKPDLMPLDNPPFYAIELWPALLNTQGGPRRNGKGRVIDSFGQKIDRLYSAGELGSIWGIMYQSDGNISEALASGRIAGRNVSLEEPLTFG